MTLSTASTITSWVLRALAAFILLQTLFFKFTGAPESVYIFSTLGVEPWGRIGTGVMELVASILLLIPRTKVIGALMAAGIMSGAILSHFFILGISVQDDGGLLFIYALIVFSCSLAVIWIHRAELLNLVPRKYAKLNHAPAPPL